MLIVSSTKSTDMIRVKSIITVDLMNHQVEVSISPVTGKGHRTLHRSLDSLKNRFSLVGVFAWVFLSGRAVDETADVFGICDVAFPRGMNIRIIQRNPTIPNEISAYIAVQS